MCSIRDEVHITKGNCIMTDTIINVSSLSFGYAGSDVLVLEDITFDIKKGEVALIIGSLQEAERLRFLRCLVKA